MVERAEALEDELEDLQRQILKIRDERLGMAENQRESTEWSARQLTIL